MTSTVPRRPRVNPPVPSKRDTPLIPLPVTLRNGYFWTEHQVDCYLADFAGQPRPPAPATIGRLFSTQLFADKIAHSSKWVKREVGRARRAAEASAKAEAVAAPIKKLRTRSLEDVG